MSREKNRIKMNDEIKELIRAKGGEMISEYEKASVKIKIKASCGCEVDMLLSNIKKQDEITCREHSRKESPKNLIKRLEEIGIQVFTDPEFIDVGAKDIAIMCSCGHSAMLNYKNLKRRAREGIHLCKECNRFGKGEPKKSKKQDKLDTAKTEFEKIMKDAGAEILTGYKNAKDHISIMCSCGHERSGTANTLKRGVIDGKIRCKSCAGKNSHKKWTEDDWRSKALSCGYKSVEFFDGMTRVEAVGSCDHKIEIQMGGFKKKLQKGVSTCRNCTTQANRDFTEYKIRTLLKKHNCEFKSYSPEDRFCELKYACGHEGRETYPSLQRKDSEDGEIKCTECIVKDRSPMYNKRNSKCELGLIKFVKSISNDVKTRYRESYPHGIEIDVLDNKSMVGFEMNGMYWHSEESGKSSSYHKEKSVHFSKKGIKIIHIFEKEWEENREQVFSIIRDVSGNSLTEIKDEVKVKEVEKVVAAAFFHNNSIYGSTGTSSDSVGIFVGETMVGAVSVRKHKDSKTIELAKFTILNGVKVTRWISAVTTFLSSAYRDYTSVRVVLNSRFHGVDPENTVFYENGFNITSRTQPVRYFYKGTSKLFSERTIVDELVDYDPNIKLSENIRSNGFGVIYDCGRMVMEAPM